MRVSVIGCGYVGAVHAGCMAKLDTEKAVHRVDALLLVREWKQYRGMDPYAIAGSVGSARILDGRNVVDPDKWRPAGWTTAGSGVRSHE